MSTGEMHMPETTRYKTGQRVPQSGTYVDQYGFRSHHERHATFPPCIGRKGECAYRRRLDDASRGAA